MNNKISVLIYGASGYTGKLVAESLAQRDMSFYFSGRNRERLEAALDVVNERHGSPVKAEIVTADSTVDELLPLFKKVDVVINVTGPFMQIGWPIVEAALEAGCHYIDTSGEQDWTNAVKEKLGSAFAEKNLLLCPACSYMWAAGSIAAEVVLETEGVDSLDILYQIENALPSEASTKSFLRMVCNDVSQYYLDLNELKPWANDKMIHAVAPNRNYTMAAHPWGGGCEPIWYKDDPRVRNCKVIAAGEESLMLAVIDAIKMFNEQAAHLSQPEREAWTNTMGDQMDNGEPEKDDIDVQRGVIVCNGQGRQVTTQFVMNLSAPYTWTGDMCAEAAQRLIDNQHKSVGFQSPAKAFGHRELLEVFHERGFCNLPD
ncbi:MAG: DUF5938 domain-containing protein [Pseudomonadales bacterium]